MAEKKATATKKADTKAQLSAKVFDITGKEKETINLPEEVFGAKWNPDLVHQVVVSMQSNARVNTASAKDRSEVSGGGKKPWRQKGTGRARHGSSRSPIWRGGGVTFGPSTERNYKKKINKKMRAKAFASALSEKLRSGQVVFVDDISFEAPKTKEAVSIISALAKSADLPKLATKKVNTAVVAVPQFDDVKNKSFRNIPGFSIESASSLNPVILLKNTYLIIDNPKESIKMLEARVNI